MSKQWKWMLALAAALMLTVAVSQAADAAGPAADDGAVGGSASPRVSNDLLDLKVGSDGQGRTEVVLSAAGPMTYESFLLESPDRLVLDLQGVTSRLEQSKFRVDRGGVIRIRAAQHAAEPQPVTRVVFDLEGPVPYTVDRVGPSLVVHFDTEAAEPPVRPAVAPSVKEEPAPIPAVTDLVQEMESRLAEHEPAAEPTAVGAVRPDSAPPQATVVEAGDENPPAAPQPAGGIEATSSGTPSRAVEGDLIERLLRTPVLAAPSEVYKQPGGSSAPPASFETKTIVTDEVSYVGKEISLNLVDADIKQVFRLFHEISGLNFVLDPGVSGRVTIVLDHVPWDQALDIILKNNSLDKVLENNVIRIASTQKLAQEAASRKQLKEAKDLEVEPITITRTLSYAKAAEVERVIRDSGVLTGRGKVIVDTRTNTLIISDIPKKVDPLDTLISTLDAETPQVMIEARVVETSRDFSQDLGVVWGLEAIADASKGTSTGLAFPHNASLKYGLNLPGGGGASALALKFGNVIDSFTLDVALNTIENEGSGRVLSSPKIATQNNERAEIEQGVRIPVVNTTATEISVEFVSASLKMTVTPQITADGTIILDVAVENNSPDFVNTAGGIPSIRTQRAQTKVLISDGGTTVIGGIFTVNEGRSEVGVPWFRKLPVFGWLFKSTNVTRQNRELLIFITPKIMRVA